MPMLTDDAREADAQKRLGQRAAALGWPSPPPDAHTVRAMALAGNWPPANAKAPPVPQVILDLIRTR